MITSKYPLLSKHYRQLLQMNYLAWLTYFLVYLLYAYFWRQFSQSDEFQYTPLSSLIWFAKEWGVWLFISPIMLGCLHVSQCRSALSYVPMAVVFVGLLVALMVRTLLITGEYSSSWIATILFTLPKYVPAAIAIGAGWYLLRNYSCNDLGAEPTPETCEAEVYVEHKGLKQTVKAKNIVFLKSAGNYVEIVCDAGCFIQRGTFKQLLDSMPKSMFAQVHRSYAVNLTKLEKLSSTENGNSVLTLSNQQKIPVSKRYKRAIKSIALSQ